MSCHLVCIKLYLVCCSQILFFKKCVSLLCLALKVTQSLQGGGYIEFKKLFDMKIFQTLRLTSMLMFAPQEHLSAGVVAFMLKTAPSLHEPHLSWDHHHLEVGFVVVVVVT